jgi:tRNA/rRNA methyltransferase
VTGRARPSIGLPGNKPLVILSRPQIGDNAGAVARAMLNFGLTELRMVKPDFGWPNAKAVAAASGAAEVLNGVRIFDTLTEALFDVQHLFATTARNRELNKPIVTPSHAAAEARDLCAEGRRVAFLFGAERTGLTNDETALADMLVTVPTNPKFSSLNLGQAVLLLSYEYYRLHSEIPAVRAPASQAAPASKAEVQGALDHLLHELDTVDFFRTAERRISLSLAITQLFERRAMTTSEVDLLRGIVKDLAIGRAARARPVAS